MLALHIALGIIAGFLILDFLRSVPARQKALSYIKVILKPFIFIYKVLKSFLIDFVKLWWHWLVAAVPALAIFFIGLYLGRVLNQDWIFKTCAVICCLYISIAYAYTSRND